MGGGGLRLCRRKHFARVEHAWLRCTAYCRSRDLPPVFRKKTGFHGALIPMSNVILSGAWGLLMRWFAVTTNVCEGFVSGLQTRRSK